MFIIFKEEKEQISVRSSDATRRRNIKSKPGMLGANKFEETPRQRLPGRRKSTKKGGILGREVVWAQGVEAKEAPLSPSCALINMQEVILLVECINLPCAPGMRGVGLSQGECRPNSPAFQRIPHLLAQAAPSLPGFQPRPPGALGAPWFGAGSVSSSGAEIENCILGKQQRLWNPPSTEEPQNKHKSLLSHPYHPGTSRPCK